MVVLVKEFETFTNVLLFKPFGSDTCGTPAKPSTSMIECAITGLIIAFLGEPNFGGSFPKRNQKITTSENNFSIYLIVM